MSARNSTASASSTSSSNSSIPDTEDDRMIAEILAEGESSSSTRKLGKRLSHLGSIPHTPRVISEIPDVSDATLDHERLSERLATYDLAELQIEGDGNCQFRALADQLFRHPDYHKHVRRQVIKQLKHHRKLYEGYVPGKYRSYLRKMKKFDYFLMLPAESLDYFHLKYLSYIICLIRATVNFSRSGEWGDHVTLQAAADRFAAKICLVTSFRDTNYIEIMPKNGNPTRELWLSFWSEVHYNSLYASGDVPTRVPKKKYWLF